MTATPPNDSNIQPGDSSAPIGESLSAESLPVEDLLRSLRRKEGAWVAWGQACQQLQKGGYSPQKIFEETGFEPVQQNQITVAAQVYGSIATGGAAPAVLARFDRTGSDALYEFRILKQEERVAAATLWVEKGLDSEGAKEIAKALKDFSRLSKPPEDFSDYPGDAVALSYWGLARQQADLQARSRLIAQALRFVRSEPARKQIEKLLTDFTVTRSRPAPRIPFYRLESAEEQPRVVPVVGQLPLSIADYKAAPMVEPEGKFNLVRFSGVGAWVALPGWQIVINAEDPVMILAETAQLPVPQEGDSEDVLILVDRSQRQWDEESYFVLDEAGQLKIDWSDTELTLPIVGKVALVLRSKRVLDEDFNKQLWQIDE